MKRIAILVVIAAVLGVGIVAWTSRDNDKPVPTTDDNLTTHNASDTPTQSSNNTNTQSQAEETDKVTIKDFAFGPSSITVKRGTTVTWTNQDDVRHDVTPVKSDDFEQSEMLGKGQSYSVTFDKVGTFAYFCSPHPYMKGQVIVTE